TSRFPAADEVVVQWPHRYLAAEVDAGRVDPRTVVCVLTHDPKFDVPVLEQALRLPDFAYVGAMGSRRTHDDRVARLREAGVTDAELARLSSPIGLDLGARTPEETAVSIAAEIIASQWGGGGNRLQHTEGPIHHSTG
ncbi:MAG: XdhC family protein, partial [Dermatophilaceae bacterium]